MNNGRGEGPLERIFFLVGQKGPKISALINFLVGFLVAHEAAQQG